MADLFSDKPRSYKGFSFEPKASIKEEGTGTRSGGQATLRLEGKYKMGRGITVRGNVSSENYGASADDAIKGLGKLKPLAGVRSFGISIEKEF